MVLEKTTNSASSLTSSGVDLDNLQHADHRTVLVVDDKPDTIVLLKHIFINNGFNVSGANSGKEALHRLPDVIIIRSS